MRPRRLAPLLASLAIAAGLTGCDLGGDSPASDIEHPNVLVVMTDDQASASWLDGLPTVRRGIAERGTTFNQAFVSDPLCCPSRAAFLTGEYGHNNGVLDNEPGYPALREPGSVLPVWLRRAGYNTAHVGKWLHHYADTPGTHAGTKPPPGWDEWDGLLDAKYYDYEMSVNGDVESFGERPADYATDVITDYGLRFLRDANDRPFFLSLAYVAPHVDAGASSLLAGPCAGNAIPARSDMPEGDEPGFPRSPATNEADVADKPDFISALPPLDPVELGAIDQAFRCEQASLRAVDRGVARILEELRRTGQLERTLIVFTSDNGTFHGEHRIAHAKGLPYAPATKVPLAIRPPGEEEDDSSQSEALVANVDLAPTILDFAGATPCVAGGECRSLDGLSLRPLLDGDESEWPADRGIVLESEKRTKGQCGWSALLTPTNLYSTYRIVEPGGPHPCERAPGELYDLDRDPFELESVAGDPDYAEVQDQLAERLAELKDCSGESCH
jgi:N-acetylglucosamine-6-sulfatase